MFHTDHRQVTLNVSVRQIMNIVFSLLISPTPQHYQRDRNCPHCSYCKPFAKRWSDVNTQTNTKKQNKQFASCDPFACNCVPPLNKRKVICLRVVVGGETSFLAPAVIAAIDVGVRVGCGYSSRHALLDSSATFSFAPQTNLSCALVAMYVTESKSHFPAFPLNLLESWSRTFLTSAPSLHCQPTLISFTMDRPPIVNIKATIECLRLIFQTLAKDDDVATLCSLLQVNTHFHQSVLPYLYTNPFQRSFHFRNRNPLRYPYSVLALLEMSLEL